ncbi:MAG: hypothetical protein ACI9R3_001219 [Verrucomicrobiales bacterium]|jgi:hypothetical protein
MRSKPKLQWFVLQIFLLMVIACNLGNAQSPVRFQQIDLVPEVGGSVEVVGTDGKVRSAGAFYQPTSGEEDAAPTSLSVGPGETIRTKKDSAIALLGQSGSMRLAPNSQVQVPSATEAKTSLKLQAGRVMVHIDLEAGKPDQEIIINGQSMTVGMREGKLFVETGADGSEVVGVHEGKAAITKDGKKAEVGRGKVLEIDRRHSCHAACAGPAAEERCRDDRVSRLSGEKEISSESLRDVCRGCGNDAYFRGCLHQLGGCSGEREQVRRGYRAPA